MSVCVCVSVMIVRQRERERVSILMHAISQEDEYMRKKIEDWNHGSDEH